MATFHISQTDAARDLSGLLDRVRSGAEVVIEGDHYPIAVMHLPAPPRRTIEECIALLPVESTGIIDEDFAADVASGVAWRRQNWRPSAWD